MLEMAIKNKMTLPTVIKRHSVPTSLDQAPKGTKCLVIGETEAYEIYIQISPHEDDPKWEYMGIGFE